MRVNHWLIGCAICFVGIGSAAATTADSREMDNTLRGNGDSSAHDSSNGAEPGLARDNTTHSASSYSHKGAPASGSDHTSGDIAPATHTQPAHLGWQSLLPGSIQ